jgi:AraC-like DNA-binding protein
MDDSCSRMLFTTDALRERDRFPMFCEEMFRGVIGCDIEDHGSTGFRGALEIRRAGPVIIAKIETTPADIIRDACHMRDGNDAIVVQLWRQGAAHLTQGRRENEVKACEGIVLDNTKLGRLCVQEASRVWCLTIPRNAIARLRPNVNRLAGTKLRDDLSLRLLFGYLEGTLAQELGNHRATRLFGNHLVDLVALALAGEDEALEDRDGIRAARVAAILQAIATQASDRGLNAASVAAQLGITPRYVHVLLEQSGQTFTQHVLQKRLEMAAALLSDDAGQERKVADIALAVGFADLSHFNRAFRRHFGDTPSGVRASATLGGSRR